MMRFNKLVIGWFLVISFLFLGGCAGEEITKPIVEEVEVAAPLVEEKKDEVIEHIIEKEEPKPEDALEQDVIKEQGSLTFINTAGNTYVLPKEKLHVKEGWDRLNFDITEGDYIVLESQEETRVLQITTLDTTRKSISFVEMQEETVSYESYYDYIEANIKDLLSTYQGEYERDGVRKTEGFFEPMTYTEVLKRNPLVTFDAWADTRTLGKGKLKIEDYGEFVFFVANKVGNPIAMDLNGDGLIDGMQILIHTQSGNVIEP